ncbi:hypothetical protein KJZ61_04510, partial [Candidatus Dependentiae bacterium]|nr:hypothetical protein [Candidatus Dependentiae bacterium]
LVKNAIFDKNVKYIPQTELVIIKRSDGTMRFGRVIRLKGGLTFSGKDIYEILVDESTNTIKQLPPEEIGRLPESLKSNDARIGQKVSIDDFARIAHSRTNAFRKGELIALTNDFSSPSMDTYEYAEITAPEKPVSTDLIQQFNQGHPINFSTFEVKIVGPYGDKFDRNVSVWEIGKITPYHLGETVPYWIQERAIKENNGKSIFGLPDQIFQVGEMVAVYNVNERAVKFARIVGIKLDDRGKVAHCYVIVGVKPTDKLDLVSEQIGKIAPYL